MGSKPLEFIVRGRRGLVQPAVKCRGREYLRIIYGPEYTAAENLERLRSRGLGAKRSLALREFALGIQGLERFVRREPLRRVHECVFGVLALESEPVDPEALNRTQPLKCSVKRIKGPSQGRDLVWLFSVSAKEKPQVSSKPDVINRLPLRAI
jgi:hypothetical protein